MARPCLSPWIPACARMTVRGETPRKPHPCSCGSRSLLGHRSVPGLGRFLLSQEHGGEAAPRRRGIRHGGSPLTSRYGKRKNAHHTVIPAQAGIQSHVARPCLCPWIPACAGMTIRGETPRKPHPCSCGSRSLLEHRSVPGLGRFLLSQEHGGDPSIEMFAVAFFQAFVGGFHGGLVDCLALAGLVQDDPGEAGHDGAVDLSVGLP